MSLFSPYQLGNAILRNRIAISPICLYSATEGVPNDWHLVHLGCRAVGGAGLVLTEATAVSARGRITRGCTGLWNETQQIAWTRIAIFIRSQGAVPGIQLAHAGRKASTDLPWHGGCHVSVAAGGWQPVAPSAIAFDTDHTVPSVLDGEAIRKVIIEFAAAARRARAAGFGVIEIHAAHGYLFHEFLSPLSNRREDEFGGCLENRARLLRSVVLAIRKEWPRPLPLMVRVSATDWAPEGWDIEECVQLARWLKIDGVDLIDTSSGGNVADVKIPTNKEYQVHFSARIRHEAGIATGAVGLITTGPQANDIITRGDADIVLFAREVLRDPYFPRRAAAECGAEIPVPEQYLRAW